MCYLRRGICSRILGVGGGKMNCPECKHVMSDKETIEYLEQRVKELEREPEYPRAPWRWPYTICSAPNTGTFRRVSHI